MSIFLDYPVATFSAILSYAIILLLLLPGIGPVARRLFAHPIPSTQQYLQSFDTLRGFAALLVAVAHLWYFAYPITAPIQLKFSWIAYGAKAVPMFAMLSGFLIFRSIRDASTVNQFRDYLFRRFFRIYPLYFVSVVGMLCLGQTETARGDYGTLFVLVVPKHRMLLATLILAFALVIADQWLAREFYMWKYFFFGILVAEFARRVKLGPLAGTVVFLIGLVWLCLDMRGPKYDVFANWGLVQKNQAEYTIGLGLSFGLIMFGLQYAGAVASWLNVYPLRFTGIVSYSVFLIHPFYLLANFPALKFFKPVPTELWKTFPVMPSWYFALVYVPGVLVWAAVAFLLVERPALEFGKRWLSKRRKSQSVSATPLPAE